MPSSWQYRKFPKKRGPTTMDQFMGNIHNFLETMLFQYFKTKTLFLLNTINKNFRNAVTKIVREQIINNKKRKLMSTFSRFKFALDIELYVCLSAPPDHPMCPINIHKLLKKIRPMRLKIILVSFEDIMDQEFSDIYPTKKLANYYADKLKLVDERKMRVMLDVSNDSLTDVSTLMTPKIDTLMKCFGRKIKYEKTLNGCIIDSSIINNIKSVMSVDAACQKINNTLLKNKGIKHMTIIDNLYYTGHMSVISKEQDIKRSAIEEKTIVYDENDPDVLLCCNASTYLKNIEWLYVPDSVLHFEMQNRIAKKTSDDIKNTFLIDDTPIFNINVLMSKISRIYDDDDKKIQNDSTLDYNDNRSVRFVDMIFSENFFPQFETSSNLNANFHLNGHIGKHDMHIGKKRTILFSLMSFINCFALTYSEQKNTITFLPLTSDEKIREYLHIPNKLRNFWKIVGVSMYFEYTKNHSILLINDKSPNDIEEKNSIYEIQKIINKSAFRDTAVALREFDEPFSVYQTYGEYIRVRDALNVLQDIGAIVMKSELVPELMAATDEIKNFYNKHVRSNNYSGTHVFMEIPEIEKRIIEEANPVLSIVAKEGCTQYVEWVLVLASLMCKPIILKTMNFVLDVESNDHINTNCCINMKRLIEEEYFAHKNHRYNVLKRNLWCAYHKKNLPDLSTTAFDKLEYFFPLKINIDSVCSYADENISDDSQQSIQSIRGLLLNLKYVNRATYIPM